MDAATFIDKVLTPLAGGVGLYLATLSSPNLKSQSKGAKALMIVAVVVTLGCLKWLAVI